MKHNQNTTDVIFADDGEIRNNFSMGFAWGCAASAGLCLIIVALAAALGN